MIQLFSLDNRGHQNCIVVGDDRVENGDLRNTLIKQSWKQVKGAWRLTEEVRAEGDAGLIGDPVPAGPTEGDGASLPKKPAQFPTIRLGSTENAPAGND